MWEVLPENTTREPVAWTELSSLVERFNGKGYCGRQDWRVPTHAELQGVINYGRIAPAVEQSLFPDADNGGYWSSDSFVLKPEQAWLLLFVDGNSKPAFKSSKQKYRLVAQVQAQAGLKLQARPDDTVLDERTGLIWDRCSLGQAGKDCEQGQAEKFTWQDALKASTKANQERYKGYDDWRVPNVKELLSIVDIARYCPSVEVSAFPKTACYWYWSSTPRATDPSKVWDIGFDDGHIGFGLEDLEGHVRLVRNGTSLDRLKQSEKLD